MEKAVVNIAECRNCGCCVRSCPTGALHFAIYKVRIEPEECVACTECVKACPFGAISMKESS